MLKYLLTSKIHRATVTDADPNYIGSISIDQALMDAAGILPWERVQVVDIDNGARLETYVIPAECGSGAIKLNGAAARLVSRGDCIIIMAYAMLTEEEIKTHSPVIVFVDDQNQVVEVRTGSAQADSSCC